MAGFIIRRLLALIPLLFGITLITFFAVRLAPGDPVEQILGQNTNKQAAEQLRQHLGLNQPLPVQYVRWLDGAVRGDFGRSLITDVPVTQEIVKRFPSTFELAVAAFFVMLAVGIPLGIAAAVTRQRWLDSLLMMGALGGLSIPSFWLGLLLLIVFGVKLGWLPVVGGSGIRGLVLPAVTLGVAPAAIIARLARSSMLEVIRQDYIQTARAKGLVERVVIYRHAFRNSLIPILTVLGITFGNLLGGTVIIEAVFSRGGLGTLAIRAIETRDFPLIQGIVIFYAVLYVLCNLAVDVIYGVADPRIRY